jgi:SIT4-associating protein SAP185/190
MFWRFGAYNSISTLDAILDKPDATVEELLDESDLIQELKQNNSKLIEFLREEHVLERLLQYVTAQKVEQVEPSPEEPEEEEETVGGALGFFGGRSKRRSQSKSINKTDEDEETKEEKQRLKYAYVSCEVLSSDVWSIAEALLENPQNLRKFWEYIKREPPLDAVQAGYFTKVNESLLDKKTEETLDFFKTIDNVVPDMVQHVDCPVIMDLLLKIISLERSEGGQGIVDVSHDLQVLSGFMQYPDSKDSEMMVLEKDNNISQWLQSQNLIPLLLARLSPEYPPATQTAAGDFLKAIITISANATAQDTNVIGPNELTRQLVSKECIQTLITEMLRGGNPLTVGVGIVIEVIRKNNSDYDLDNQVGPVPKSSDPIYLGTLLRQFAENVPKFMELIQRPSENGKKRELRVAFGDKIEPLGFDRFKTCELMAELLHCSNMALLNEKGAEADIQKRNVERERLKAEGKLTPAREGDLSADNEFDTSVDSSGFHHARAPSFDSDSPEEIKRTEATNGADDEFINVNVSAGLGDEMKDDFDEKEALVGDSGEKAAVGSEPEKAPIPEAPRSPKSPRKEAGPRSPAKPDARFSIEQADSPTSAGVTEKLESVDLGSEDTEMKDPDTEEPKGKSEDSTAPTHTEGLSPHPEDTPPPLFARKLASEQSPLDPSQVPLPIEPQSTHDSLNAEPQEQHDDSAIDLDDGLPYVIDIDGNPVVGDLLKIKFVENRVVPTILVRLSDRLLCALNADFRRTSSSDFHGTTSSTTLCTM